MTIGMCDHHLMNKAEAAIVEAIQQGLEDMHAGRVIPHEEAMRRLRAAIARAAKKKPTNSP
jgi:predicted transcriptional regulator